MSACTVYMTVGSPEEAKTIARDLVERRLAACVNMMLVVQSVYQWEGEVAEDNEVVMFAKTQRKLVNDLTARVKELHSYDVPCIVSLSIEGGHAPFLDWIHSETEPKKVGN